MNIFFAGCARDCANYVALNIVAILAIADKISCDKVKIFVAENNSKDETRAAISQLASQDNRVIPVFFDDLDETIVVREARIAFCRDRLLDEILKSKADGLYVPIDLDAPIATSLLFDQFQMACRLVSSGSCVGIFPSSRPYYYDIHALREPVWCPRSSWKDLYDANARGALWSLLAYIFFISSKQQHYLRLQVDRPKLIPVLSAFGGMGIYSLSAVAMSGARYSSPDLEQDQLKLCEHVVFNAFLKKLFIYPEWVIAAPPEHIGFCLLSNHQKAWSVVRAALVDIKRIALCCFK